MLPVCSATPCSSLSQVFLNEGFRNIPRFQKLFDVRCHVGDIALSSLSNGVSIRQETAGSVYSSFVRSSALLSTELRYSTEKVSDTYFLGRGRLTYVEDSIAAVSQEEQLSEAITDNIGTSLEPASEEPMLILDQASGDQLSETVTKTSDALLGSAGEEPMSGLNQASGEQLSETMTNNADTLLEPANKEPLSILDQASDSISNATDALKANSDSFSTSSNSSEDMLSQTNESIGASISKGKDILDSSLDSVNSNITGVIEDGNELIDNVKTKILLSVDQTGELTRSRLVNLPSELKEAGSKAGVVAVDLLRKTIVVAEDSLTKGTKFVYYSYESSKELLPPEIQNGLVSFEEKSGQILRPVGTVFQQVYSAVEELEKSLGLDPSDPIVPFLLFLGTSSTLWAVYWVATYSGYAGDLSPQMTFDLLTGKENAVLIDVRPEDLREREGIPDLRRGARFRYAHVSLPKVDGSLRKLMKRSKDLDDILTATVIRNLKNVRDSSKIIVMDADGSQTKGIARTLRKLGVKRPYVLNGGFQSWVKEGLRIKELKPETAITILNEDAEAILEELNPTLPQLLGIGVGSIAALYALVEWERSLQLIGVIGIVLTIYRRVASYEDQEDFRKDMRLLISPVTLGAQAVSWAAPKGETNGNGLPVSPSSTDVQNRVLQAAAKHESQPFDDEGSEEPQLDLSTAANEDTEQLET